MLYYFDNVALQRVLKLGRVILLVFKKNMVSAIPDYSQTSFVVEYELEFPMPPPPGHWNDRLVPLATIPDLCSARDRTQGVVHARQILQQMTCTHSPWVSSWLRLFFFFCLFRVFSSSIFCKYIIRGFVRNFIESVGLWGYHGHLNNVNYSILQRHDIFA